MQYLGCFDNEYTGPVHILRVAFQLFHQHYSCNVGAAAPEDQAFAGPAQESRWGEGKGDVVVNDGQKHAYCFRHN